MVLDREIREPQWGRCARMLLEISFCVVRVVRGYLGQRLPRH